MDADILSSFDFTPDFGRLRSLAQIIASRPFDVPEGAPASHTVTSAHTTYTPAYAADPHLPRTSGLTVLHDLMRAAFIEACSLIAAWPVAGVSMGRAEALEYFGKAARLNMEVVCAVAHFGPDKTEMGVKATQTRTVTGLRLPTAWALHPHADLRTWVFGQTDVTFQGWDSYENKADAKAKYKIKSNAASLPFGLAVKHETIRPANAQERAAWLLAPSPVHEAVGFEIPDAERVLKNFERANAAAPFWAWTSAKELGE